MRHRFRSAVWRELPFSARRAIVGAMRSVDRLDEIVAEFWASLQFSSAWAFVASAGTLGIVLTVMLFLSLAQEMLARSEQDGPLRPLIIDSAELRDADDEIDTRVCLEETVHPQPNYDAEFAFRGALAAAWPTPSDAPPPRSRRSTTVAAEASDEPDLRPEVNWLRHRQRTAHADHAPETTSARSTTTPHEDAHTKVPSRSRSDGWHWSHGVVETAAISVPQAYTGDPVLMAGHDVDEDVWADPQAWPGKADVALRVEMHAPEQASVGLPGRSLVVIRNIGDEPVRRLRLQESASLLPLITGAEPDAHLAGGLLEREFRRLRPGRDRTLALTWFPRSVGDHHHEARVVAEAVVAATVEVAAEETKPQETPPRRTIPHREDQTPIERVEPLRTKPIESRLPAEHPVTPRRSLPLTPHEEPSTRPPESEPTVKRLPDQPRAPLRTAMAPEARPAPVKPQPAKPAVVCTVRAAKTVAIDEPAELQIEVRNTGDTALNNVRIWADVPATLKHRHGSKLECPVGQLQPGELHQTVLRVVGQQAGTTLTAFRIVADEPIQAESQGRLTVIETSQLKSPQPPLTRSSRVVAPSVPRSCVCPSQVVWLSEPPSGWSY